MKSLQRLFDTVRAAAVAAALAACSPQASDTGAAALVPSEHELGRSVYNFRCYFCHGYSGDAKTMAATFLATAPRDFTAAAGPELDRERIERILRDGQPGTGMKSFAAVLSEPELLAVAGFVYREFVVEKGRNTRYHTAENGWPDHERYRAAFPFATGERSLDPREGRLDPEEAAGRRLFMSACITCHDRGARRDETTFALRSVSYPPGNYVKDDAHAAHALADPDDPYEKHDRANAIAGLSARERRGGELFRSNCAYCHAQDGTGRNWIGAFIDPPPADFTRADVRRRFTAASLRAVVRDGIANTSMPAWGSVLTRAEIDAVVGYLLRAFPAPAAAAGNAPRAARN